MIHSLDQSEISEIWKINQNYLPMVSSVSLDWFQTMAPQADYFSAYKVEDFRAFLLAFGPGLDYESPNYQWFCNRYNDDFVYIDRIVVQKPYQRQGLGRKLYQDLEKKTKYSRICCEVNIRPKNQDSLDFHKKMGFYEVGQQDTEGGSKRVSLLCKDL